MVASGDYKNVADPTCAPFELVPCDVFITEATFALPVFRHGDPGGEIAKLLRSVALFPERAHLVGAYSLGKAQRVIALLRQAGYDAPIYLHGAMEKITRYYESRGIALGELRLVSGATKQNLAGTITICPPSALNDLWTRRFPDPLAAFASGWMRVRARARQQGVSLPLVISDHADWDGLTATIAATGAGEIWVTHGQEDALVHWCGTRGLKARPLDIVGYGDEDDEPAQRRGGGMNRFAELLDRLAYEPARNNKLRLITEYFRSTPDPERGWALAALTGALSFPHAKAGLIRSLIAERTDPVLFELSYDYVGDLSETVALMWPSSPSPLVGEGGVGGREGKSQASTVVNEQSSPPSHHLPTPTPNPSPQGRRGTHTHHRHRNPLHARQGATAEAARALARCARRDRALGADQARHRRLAHRRLGAARQDRGRGAVGHRRAGHRAAVAGAGAALSRPVRLARRPGGKTGEQRSGAVPAADAGACAR